MFPWATRLQSLFSGPPGPKEGWPLGRLRQGSGRRNTPHLPTPHPRSHRRASCLGGAQGSPDARRGRNGTMWAELRC